MEVIMPSLADLLRVQEEEQLKSKLLGQPTSLGSPEEYAAIQNAAPPPNMTGQNIAPPETAHPVGSFLNAIGGYAPQSKLPMQEQPATNKIGYTLGSIVRELGLKMNAPSPMQIESQKFQEQSEIRKASKEDRLGKVMELNNIKTYGSTLGEEDLKRLGLDASQYAEAGGATPRIGEDGKRVWDFMPEVQFRQKVAQGKFDTSEIEKFQLLSTENTRWKDVVDSLESIGINEKNAGPKDLGSISWESIETPMGPLSIPARFNLAGQYMKDPKYTAIKRKIEMAFQAMRTRVTGAQASDKELQYLRKIMPVLKDNPAVFYSTIIEMQNANVEEMKTRADVYSKFGRDTTEIQKYLGEQGANIKQPSGVPIPKLTNDQAWEIYQKSKVKTK